MGYLPGLLWILVGVVFAGAVQDFVILFVSMRRDGRSLGELIRSELGVVPGLIALFGAFVIMVILVAVLALIIVKALADSPWGTFTQSGPPFRRRSSWASTAATFAQGVSSKCR